MLAMRVNPGEGWSVVDGGDQAGPPFLFRCNDYRGTGRAQNVKFASNGFVFATKDIPAADLNSTSIDAIAASELLISYDLPFWKIHRTLGQESNPITFEGRRGGFLPLIALK